MIIIAVLLGATAVVNAPINVMLAVCVCVWGGGGEAGHRVGI